MDDLCFLCQGWGSYRLHQCLIRCISFLGILLLGGCWEDLATSRLTTTLGFGARRERGSDHSCHYGVEDASDFFRVSG